MPAQKHVCHPGQEHRDLRLDQFLAQAFPEPVSRRQARRWIDAGAVYLDGKRVRVASRRIQDTARVEVYLGEEPADGRLAAVEIGSGHVLFEDELLIAIDKPSGIPAQATRGDAVHDLFSQVRRFLKQRDGSPDPYLALHHRLDTGTSGVMLFAKDRSVNRPLARAFAEQRIRKIYHALCLVASVSVPDGAWTVQNVLSAPRTVDGVRKVVALDPLRPAEGRPAEGRPAEGRPAEGRPATTDFRPLRVFPGAVWVEATPKTGRTHQIRVHLADNDLPVLGDRVYGRGVRPRIPASRLMLHALSLTLEHPSTGEALCIESPLPADFREEVRFLEGSAGFEP